MDNLWLKSGAAAWLVCVVAACGGGDSHTSDTTTGAPSTSAAAATEDSATSGGSVTSATTTSATTTSTPDTDATGTSGETSETGGTGSCDQQTTAEDCAAADGEFGCFWLEISNVVVTSDDVCEYTPTGEGICSPGEFEGDTTGCPEQYCNEGDVYQRTLDDGTVQQVHTAGGCGGASGPGNAGGWLMCGAQATCECGCTEDVESTSTT